jgi:ADP-ribosylglycohydrolase
VKKKGPPATIASEAVIDDRCRGALLGFAVGDALGVPNEFRNLVANDFPALNDGPTVEPRGGGRFALRPGQVGAGTQLACALAEELKNLRRYDLFETAKAYRRWAAAAFDVGETMQAALALLEEGRTPEFTGRRVWLESSQKARDNGSLARTVPLGVFFHAHRDARIEASLADSSITHFAPVCQLACAAFNGVLAAAICSPAERVTPAELKKLHEAELALAASTLGRLQPDWVFQVKDAADWLREDFTLAQADDPELYGPELHLFHEPTRVRTAYRLAFWELFHAPSYEAGVLDAANRGGDADTHAALTGALLGAAFGEGALPGPWREVVLVALQYQSGPLANRYHPRELLTLVGNSPDDR